MTQDIKNRIMELRGQGLGYKSIAIQVGLSASTVATFCTRARVSYDGICPQCGMRLVSTPHHKKKKYCSDKCRMLWWNSHQEQVNRQSYYQSTCRRCGKEFYAYGNNHRQFCSKECYSESQRKN